MPQENVRNGYSLSKTEQLLYWDIASVHPKVDMTLSIGTNANSFQGEAESWNLKSWIMI